MRAHSRPVSEKKCAEDLSESEAFVAYEFAKGAQLKTRTAWVSNCGGVIFWIGNLAESCGS